LTLILSGGLPQGVIWFCCTETSCLKVIMPLIWIISEA
jgi:hypothetical protein